MKRNLGVLLSSCLLFSHTLSGQAAEAFEIGPDNTDQLVRGKEADGIMGDFVLRNDVVEAVISGNAYLRRANMSTFYGETGVTPGCLYDLALRGYNNDQIVVFTPSGQQGLVNHVRIVKDGSDGEAVIETFISAARNGGLAKRHQYILKDGWQGVWITTTFSNESTKEARGAVADRWTKFNRQGKAWDIQWADAEDPADKAGYAYAWVTTDGAKEPGRELTIPAGETITITRFLAVGGSPLQAAGQVASLRMPTGTIQLTLKDENGAPVTDARIDLLDGKNRIPGYPDDFGQMVFDAPEGEHAFEVRAHGRADLAGKLVVKAGSTQKVNLSLGAAAGIAFNIQDGAGTSIPCKAMFKGIEGTPTPNLGPNNRAHGCVDQYHSEKGQFRVALDPGVYEVTVTHGIEFTHARQRIVVSPAKTASFAATLKRVVDTKGWISADFHNHSTPSGDNTCGTDDRIINLAAEHIEFAPTTEHNRIYDWRPHIEQLGLGRFINTVVGMEFTGRRAHMNMFPLKVVPYVQDNGAPVFTDDPRINALTLRNWQGPNPDRWIHMNHPDMVENFTDWDKDGRWDGGFVGLGSMVDGLETQNYRTSGILDEVPYTVSRRGSSETVAFNREFTWLQLLNHGLKCWAVAVADAHAVYGNGVGGWRTYVQSSSDDPRELDWKELSRKAKSGKMILTTGPYLEVSTEDGDVAGSHVRGNGGVRLNVRVQCTDWIDIDRIQVLVNGRPLPKLNFTRQSHPDDFKDGVVRFQRAIDVPLSQDAHVIVVAYGGSSDLSVGFGTSTQASIRPCAYNNPIFVDVDGNGFTPNNDDLGYPLPTAGMKPSDLPGK